MLSKYIAFFDWSRPVWIRPMPSPTTPRSETPLFDATVLATGTDPSPWLADWEDTARIFDDLADLASPLYAAEVSA